MKRILDYNKPEILKNYALWYYLKYYPSIGKLKKKLEGKTQDIELIKKTIESIEGDLREEYLLENKIDELLKKGKNKHFIINNLTQTYFRKEDISRIFEEKYIEDNYNSIIYLKQKILYSLKTKSLQTTKFNLMKSGFDREIIEKIISEDRLKDDIILIESLIEKYKKQLLEKDKIIQKMIQKGFNYNDFKEYI